MDSLDMFLEPFVDSQVADRVLRYHFGMASPNRRRSQILSDSKLILSKLRRRGSGTESIVASVAVPFLIAEEDNLEGLATAFVRSLTKLKIGEALDRDPEEMTPRWRRDVSRRFTDNLEKLARKEEALTVDKGRVVRVDPPWALVAVGDPRNDSYRLERVPSDALAASSLAKENAPFVRVLLHEAGRAPKPVYLPAWQEDIGPSPAVFEMLLRAKPAKAISDSDKRFSPRRRKK